MPIEIDKARGGVNKQGRDVMRVRMIETRHNYVAGAVYDLPKDLALMYIRGRRAAFAPDAPLEVEVKMECAAPENKMLDGPVENKRRGGRRKA